MPAPWKFFKLSPKATFYRTANDPLAIAAVPINLNTLGGGTSNSEILMIAVEGRYGATSSAIEGSEKLYAVFSSVRPTLILRPSDQQYRVPNTLDFRLFQLPTPAKFSPLTGPTYHQSLPTDLTNDFIVDFNPGGFYRTSYGSKGVPFLWVLFAVPDSYYSDNHDNNNDFGVWLRLDVYNEFDDPPRPGAPPL
jgi:hypothetical protein